MDVLFFSVIITAVVVLIVYQLGRWIPRWREGKVWTKKSRTRASKRKNPYSF
jgi:hypothetical protein